MKIKTKQRSKKPLIVITLAILLLIGGYFAYAYVSKNVWPFENSSTNAGSTSTEQDGNPVDTVSTDESGSQDAKKRLLEEENSSPDNESSTSNIQDSVTITYADVIDGNLEIRAFTDSVIESGECTATISKGSLTETATSPAFIDATSTICEPIYVDPSELESGTWSIYVTMKTSSSEGKSETVEVKIQ